MSCIMLNIAKRDIKGHAEDYPGNSQEQNVIVIWTIR